MRESEDFREFVLSRRVRLLKAAWLLTGDWHLAEDLVQVALMKTYPHWPRVAADNPDAYVRKVLYTAHASWWRRRSSREIPTEIPPESSWVDDPSSASDDRVMAIAALGRLPARQRATIVLRFFEDLSTEETATVLGCSVGTVKSQTSKALAHLRAAGLELDVESWSGVAHE